MDPLGIWDCSDRGAFMHFIPPLWMWIVWACFAATLLILLLYRGTLTRYEEDQLFLDDCSEHQHKENDELLRKVARIQPLVKILTGVTCVLTATILGIYVWDAIREFYM
jgi:hypothetical protein